MNRNESGKTERPITDETTEAAEYRLESADTTQDVSHQPIKESDEAEAEENQGRLLEMISETQTPQIRKDKNDILKRIKKKTVKPVKPTLREMYLWMTRTAGGQSYGSSQSSEIYDKFARYHFGREAEAKEIAIAFLENIQAHPNDATICERAAGTGIVTEVLVEAGFNVRASDLSRSQLDLLSKRLPNVETVQEDLNGAMVGIEDGTVDGVIEVAADRFMTPEGQRRYVQEAARVLKPGGVLIWPTSPFEAVSKLKYGFAWKSGKKEISRLLEDNGFEIVSSELRIYKLNLSAITRMIIARKKT